MSSSSVALERLVGVAEEPLDLGGKERVLADFDPPVEDPTNRRACRGDGLAEDE